MRNLVFLLPLAGCVSAPDDVVGPFTGNVHRFAVDRIALPMTYDESRGDADDLNGDGSVDDQLGDVLASLAVEHDTSTHAADMIASGAIASFVEIQADALDNDETVAVTYFGADGEPATLVGGRFSAGSFRANRTATTRVPGRAIVHLPALADADPLAVPLEGLEIDLRPDGSGGYDGWVRGGIPGDKVMPAATAGLLQMIANNPSDHAPLVVVLDANEDGKVTPDEIAASSLLASLLSPDIQLFSEGAFAPMPLGSQTHPDSLSAAFTIHLSPCETGSCALATPQDLCHDRTLDGDETDIDCGGSCGACADGAKCVAPTDCQSAGCDAGHCRAATCSDGARDAVESDVDCGWGCTPCDSGKHCFGDFDCAGGLCVGQVCQTKM